MTTDRSESTYYLRRSRIPKLSEKGLYDVFNTKTDEQLLENVTPAMAAKVCPILLANEEAKDYKMEDLELQAAILDARIKDTEYLMEIHGDYLGTLYQEKKIVDEKLDASVDNHPPSGS